jgi:hypothetical protein
MYDYFLIITLPIKATTRIILHINKAKARPGLFDHRYLNYDQLCMRFVL